MAQINPYYQDIGRLFDHGLDLGFLAGHNVLVVGATGLIGSCVVDVLMSRPHRDYHVYVSGRDKAQVERRFQQYAGLSGFTCLEIDVTRTVDKTVDFHYIIHAASPASPLFFRKTPVEVIQSNIWGVNNLMAYGIRHNLKRMLYLSSGEVYGEGNGEEFCETSSGYVDCASPRACYPSSKRAAETLCVAYAEEYGADVVIARLCHTYGPGFTEQDDRAYAQFIRNALNQEDIVLKSKGQQCRSWLYVVDAAHAILHLLDKGENKNAYNVAHPGSNITIRQLAQLIAEKTGRSVIFDIPEGNSQGVTTPVTQATFNIDKLKATGWNPLFGIDEGISHTILAAIQARRPILP